MGLADACVRFMKRRTAAPIRITDARVLLLTNCFFINFVFLLQILLFLSQSNRKLHAKLYQMHLLKELVGVFNSDTGAKVYGCFAGVKPIFPLNYDSELLSYSVKALAG